MGKLYKKSQHNYPDHELINALALKDLLGVSPAAVTKAKKAGKLDTFENSDGKECYHCTISVEQYRSKRDRRHITVATTGQRQAGFDNELAQAVAHKPKFDMPIASLAGAGFDFGEAMADAADLETSKAQKEFNLARLAKMKADEMEGKLVSKQQCAITVYQLAANVQDKIMTIYSWLAPEIAGLFKDRAEKMGLTTEQQQELCGDADHIIGEKIRRSCLNALKDIASKTVENILE